MSFCSDIFSRIALPYGFLSFGRLFSSIISVSALL